MANTLNFGVSTPFDIEMEKGQDWEWNIQVLTKQNILSSTNTSPIILTVTNHGYADGNIVYVQNHLVNTSANSNSGWTVTGSTTNTFALASSTGNGIGIKTGTVGIGTDLSSYTVLCEFRDAINGGALIATPTVTYTNRTQGKFSLALTSAQTLALDVNSAMYEIWLIKSGSTKPLIKGTVTFLPYVALVP